MLNSIMPTLEVVNSTVLGVYTVHTVKTHHYH